MNYRKLLKKYMQNIIVEEGITFIPILEDRNMFYIKMSPKEHKALLKLESEIKAGNKS